MARSYDKFRSRSKKFRGSKRSGPRRPDARRGPYTDRIRAAAEDMGAPTRPTDHIAAEVREATRRDPASQGAPTPTPHPFILRPSAESDSSPVPLAPHRADGVDYDLMEAVMDRLGIDKDALMPGPSSQATPADGKAPPKGTANQKPDDTARPAHRQPLGGRPNRRNQWLGRYAVGMDRTAGDADAEAGAGLPEWIQTLDDYRRWSSGAMDDQGRPAFDPHAAEAAEAEPPTLDLDVAPDAALAPEAEPIITPEDDDSVRIDLPENTAPDLPNVSLQQAGPGQPGGDLGGNVGSDGLGAGGAPEIGPDSDQTSEGRTAAQQRPKAKPNVGDDSLAPFIPRMWRYPTQEEKAKWEMTRDAAIVKAKEAKAQHEEDVARATARGITEEDLEAVLPPGIDDVPFVEEAEQIGPWHERWDYARDRAIDADSETGRSQMDEYYADRDRANSEETAGYDWDDVNAVLPGMRYHLQNPDDVDQYYNDRNITRDKSAVHVEWRLQHQAVVEEYDFTEADLQAIMPPLGQPGGLPSPADLALQNGREVDLYFRALRVRRTVGLEALGHEAADFRRAAEMGLSEDDVRGAMGEVAPPTEYTAAAMRDYYNRLNAARDRAIRELRQQAR